METATPNESESLKGLFQKIAGGGLEVWQGTVKSVNPLRIQAINDEKLTIGPNITIVPMHLTDYETVADIAMAGGKIDSVTAKDGSHSHNYSGSTKSAGGPPHSHGYEGTTEETAHSHALSSFTLTGAKIKVYNGLKVGETVHVLSLNRGKLHYVLDRVVK